MHHPPSCFNHSFQLWVKSLLDVMALKSCVTVLAYKDYCTSPCNFLQCVSVE